MLRIDQVTVEDLAEGCVTDERYPAISFRLASDRENVTLKSAEISLGDWRTITTSQIEVPYRGKELQPLTSYTVTVEATDDAGEKATAQTTFSTGLMGDKWIGHWISDAAYHFREKKVSPVPMQFRKAFSCDKKIEKASILATALGIYEVRLNGQKVGKDYFAPGLTSYRNTLQYQVYDVTELLREAENEIDVIVGGGWAVGAFTFSRKNRITAKRQALLMQLMITYQDGSTRVIGTDDSWLVTQEGAFRQGDFYDGEIYDATRTLEEIVWRKAAEEKIGISPRLVAAYGAPVRAQEIRKPVSCTRSKSGMLIYDFGQNFAGVIHAVIHGKAGCQVTFRHTELLMDTELYTEPLRSAKAQAVCICRTAEESYSPCLTYMGFRYVGVTGKDIEGRPVNVSEQDLELSAIVLHSELSEIGTFTCSHPLINRL